MCLGLTTVKKMTIMLIQSLEGVNFVLVIYFKNKCPNKIYFLLSSLLSLNSLDDYYNYLLE